MDRTGDIAQLVPAQLNVAESGDSNDLGRIQDVDGRSYQGISHGHDRIPVPFDQLPGDPWPRKKQTQAAKRNVKGAQKAAADQKTIAHLPADTKSALGKQGAAVAQRKRAGDTSPKTRAELYEIARKRDLPGRSKMGRDELARKLGEK